MSQIQGFHNYQISATLFQPKRNKTEITAAQIHSLSSNSLLGRSRVGNKSLGRHFHSKPSNHLSPQTESGQYIPGQSAVENSQTQAPSTGMSEQLSSQYFGNTFGMSADSGWSGSSGSSFNPNQINSQQQIFNPNSAFRSFVTQTGSNPENTKHQTTYDADATNVRYMQNGLLHYPPGVVSGQKEKDSQNPLNANGGTPQFNADALNHALMDSAYGRPGGNPQITPQFGNILNPLDLSPFHKPQSQPHSSESTKTSETSSSRQVEHEETGKQILYKTSQEQLNSNTESSPSTPENQFNFIPGSLFPSESHGSNKNLGSQPLSRPSFLSPSGNTQKAAGFDPNAINAAQAVYNPNAMSWLTPRSEPNILTDFQIEDEPTNSSSPAPQSANTTVRETTTSMPVQSKETEKIAPPGFDPNTINAKQGQSSFVPGQIAPMFHAGSGYNNNGQSTGPDYVTPYNPNSNLASGINFDIPSLLGINTANSSGTGSHVNFGGGGAGMDMANFYPDSINMNFADMFGQKDNSSNLEFGMTGLGNSFTAGGFDPNAAAFGPSNGSYNIPGAYGMSVGGGGFDANAVNMPGFGSSQSQPGSTSGTTSSNGGVTGNGFGGYGYPVMNGGGYGAGMFDANLINQNLMHTPFAAQSSNASGNIMDYFLGISQGGHNTGGGTYQSTFISAFDPSSVNQAVYDPDKFNNAHMNFDPLDMLSKTPGMDKDVLQSASFDPDKTNKEYTQINFSPVGMLGGSLGLNTSFDPASVGQASFIPSQTGMPSSKGPSNQVNQNQPLFDPVELMRQLMQDSGGFLPGSSGSQQMKFDPSSMFSQGMQSSTPQPQLTYTQTSRTSTTTATTSTKSAPSTTKTMLTTNTLKAISSLLSNATLTTSTP